MNKPSWLSYINFAVLAFLLCNYFGLIEPKNWLDEFSKTSGLKVITPIQEIKDTLLLYKRELDGLKNNDSKYALRTEVTNITNNLRLKLDKNIFEQYYANIQKSIIENQHSIKRMQGQTNISNEIKFWQNEYERNGCKYEYHVNSNLCIELRNRISNVQHKLSY